ncbi:hypothetical protein LR394_38570 [Kineosporia babensis]|uniref:Uncharacterized protein n=1 Tax=Kineosporia babensis TaxID=499548 RepID=A0A9X1NN72_9ACTN|nr:hypothetical protein [Kineosporia babensis]MCD5316816.1 hypothetical protein [Kineosporia babensis]
MHNLRRLQHHDPHAPDWRKIARLLAPLEAVNAALDSPATTHRRRAMLDTVALLLTHCAETGRTFWAWTGEEWIHLLGRDQIQFHRHSPAWAGDEVRPYLAAHAYLLGSFTDFHKLGSFQRLTLSRRIFGRARVDEEITRIRAVLGAWGYQLGRPEDTLLPMVACQVFLLNRSPYCEDLDTDLFDRIRENRMLQGPQLNTLHALQRAVADLGFCDPPQQRTGRQNARASGGARVWEQWVDRWHDTSTLTPGVRGDFRCTLLRVGRWIAAEHPEAGDPSDWTRQTCATWIAALDRMNVGDYVQRTVGLKDRLGKPLEAATKAGQITALRTFFRDCQEWDWLPQRFDPQRALAVPRTIAALLGPDPRIIADEIWAKLLWAGLNLSAEDLPQTQAGHFYPFELVRALTLTWLFSGQRSNEISRLRTGCIRWQHQDATIDSTSDHPRPGHRRMAVPATGPAEVHRSPNRGTRRSAVRRSCPACFDQLHQQYGHPDALPQGGSPARRYSWQHHQPPRPLNHRQPALQRQGTDDLVRASGVARAPIAAVLPVLREDHPEHTLQSLQRSRVFRAERSHRRSPHRSRQGRLGRRCRR